VPRGKAPLPVLLLALLAAAACREAGDDAIVASGYVEATEVRVSAKVGGTLEALLVEEGDLVAAGQEIARVDAVDLRLARDAAAAERDGADAALRLLLAGSREEDVAEARALAQRARAELDSAERDLARFQGLLDTGSGTEKQRDDAHTRRDVAAKSLQAARDRLRRLEAGSRPEEIEAARARLAAAQARIAQIDQQVADAVVRSPVAGVVTARPAEAGENVAPGAPLVVVTDLSDAWLNVYVGEQDLARIRIGQEAEVTTDDGQSRPGRVIFVSSEAEFTPKNVQTPEERVKLVYKVKVRLENGDGLFKPGMPAGARLRPAPPAAGGGGEGGR
jgi:HlyD family secretion protein